MKKIVIEIADDDYNRINSYPDGKTFYPITARLYKAVKDGTPLPKGHGRLIDANKLVSSFPNYDGMSDVAITIGYAPTIVEADKGEQE